MKCKFINVLMFAAGAALGSAVTWKVMKARYDQLIKEEIDSVKASFSDLHELLDSDTTGDDAYQEHSDKIDWSDYEDLDEEEDPDTSSDLKEYAKLVNTYTNEKGGADSMTKKSEPYVISPYDFGEIDGYNQIELTYYEGDDTLEDEDYNIVTDREELLGPKALFTFGDYEDDSVFVRNDNLKTDFQILKDYRAYSEARRTSPGRVDDE